MRKMATTMIHSFQQQFFGATTNTNQISTKQIKAIFFDMDNTLIPTRKADVKACNKLSEVLQKSYAFNAELATNVTSRYLKEFRHCPENSEVTLDIWRQHLWSQALPDQYRQYATDIYHQWLELRYRYMTVPSDVINVIQALRQTYMLAIITNGPTNSQWEKVHRLNLSKYFDCILVSDDLPWEKPDARIFMAACNYLGVEPQNCIMIGDKLETDIQGGIESNLAGTVWIPLTMDERILYERNGSQIKADCVINNLDELITILPIQLQRSASMVGHQPPVGQIKGTGTTTRKLSLRTSNLAGSSRRRPYNSRVASLPDLESGNSNSSDGS